MSVNRYNPYYNTAPARGQPGQYPTQQTSNQTTASQRDYEPAVWQWVPDSPQDLRGSFRVLMSGLPTENVAKKEIVELFSSHVTPDVKVDPIFDDANAFTGSCIFTMKTVEDVLKTYDAFEGKYFDDMATQITVELLIRPGARVPVKLARQIINEDQIIAVAPIKPQAQSVNPPAYYGNGQSASSAPAASSSHVAQQSSAPIPTGPSRSGPREPAWDRQNGAPANQSAPTRPRAQQQQNGAPQAPKNQNNHANVNKNTSAGTSGKSLLQRMNIPLAERISGGPVAKGNSPTEPAASKKNKKLGGAGGPDRPNASIANQARRNMKPYAPFPASTPTHPKAQIASNQQQPKRKETQQEILDRELENFQKKRGK